MTIEPTTYDEMEQLQQSLEETRSQLSEARETISRLEAENAELRRRLDEPEAQAEGAANNSVGSGNKNGQAGGEVNGTTAQPQDAGAGSSQSAPSGQDAGANEEKKDEDTNATGISSARPEEETNGEESRHNSRIEEKGAGDNAPAQDTSTDQPVQNGRNDDQDDASVESTNDVESESDDNDEDDVNNKEPPTSPADDIRLRAARTLIWADSAIKRAEALKEQQQQASSSQQASQQASASEQSSLVGGSGSRRGGKPPSTVRFSQSVDDDSEADDDSSFLSDEDDDDDDDAAAGPLARIGRFLEDKMDDVAERLVALDPSDKGSLQSGSVGGGAGTGTGKPPRSPANYKYCNDAMKKKMGGDGEDDSHSARTPTSARSGGDGGNDSDKKAPPMMNEAMKRLSSEKNKRGGLGSRLFKG